MSIAIIIVIYLFGFFTSLIILHKYGNQLGLASVDEEESDASSYAAMSTAWPLFWLFFGIFGFFKMVVGISELIGKKVNNGSRN